MFSRVIFADTAVLFGLAAFVTAFSIFVTFAWRALRMKKPQLERFEHLPFNVPTPSADDPRHAHPTS